MGARRGGHNRDLAGSTLTGTAAPAVPIGPFRHSRGPADAPVVVVEYADFECPYCARAAPVLHEFTETSQGQARLVFRHFPVFDVHPYALTAAHGRFWEMHDQLFAHQDRLAVGR
ncbi:DsbA family protein [Frankia sp. CcWB2]